MARASPRFRAIVLKELGLSPLWARRTGPAGGDAVRQANAHAPQPRARASGPELFGRAASASPGRPETALLGWAELQERIEECRACALGATRKRAVVGVGAAKPQWLLVGEAPGAEEDERGEPFVGEAGRLLDNMLGAIGIARGREVYIANVIKCRPPGNRNPEPDEIAQCSPYLLRQIELLEPTIVVALGRFAAQTLLNTPAPVGTLRGRVHRLALGGMTRPVVVTYHPAYLLRNLADKQKAWEDLCLARRTLAAQETTATATVTTNVTPSGGPAQG